MTSAPSPDPATTLAPPMPPATLPPAARRHDVVTAVGERLRTSCGPDSGGPLVVGVSGGSDSVALLLALAVLSARRRAPDPPSTPIAVHVHHHLRGDEADEDAAFLAGLCTRLGVALRVEHVRPATLPGNLSDNARTLRYRALADAARSVGATRVAVAHHADDQLETILMALCRGAGLDGLTGMAWSRPLEDDVSLIRPLLAVESAACVDLCRCAGVSWREDPTNVDARRVRGRLRRDVLPVLETLWPGVAGRALATVETLDAARAALEREVAAAFGAPHARRWPRERLATLTPPVIAAGLRRAAVDAAPGHDDAFGRRLLLPPAEVIASAARRPRAYDWPGGLRLRITTREVALSEVAGDGRARSRRAAE